MAAAVLESEDLALSVQVLLEFYAQSTRSRPSGRGSLAHEQAALATKKRHQISIWDATIMEAARTSGCDVILG